MRAPGMRTCGKPRCPQKPSFANKMCGEPTPAVPPFALRSWALRTFRNFQPVSKRSPECWRSHCGGWPSGGLHCGTRSGATSAMRNARPFPKVRCAHVLTPFAHVRPRRCEHRPAGETFAPPAPNVRPAEATFAHRGAGNVHILRATKRSPEGMAIGASASVAERRGCYAESWLGTASEPPGQHRIVMGQNWPAFWAGNEMHN